MSEPVVVTPGVLREWALPGAGGGKDARGRVCVLGGTDATVGAVRLAGEASLRAGGGKLAVATVADAVAALGVAMPEAAVTGLPTDDDGNLSADGAQTAAGWADGADVVVVGSGFSDPDASVALLRGLAPELGSTVVVDALASAFLTEHPDGLHHLDGRAILSVNPTELARTAHASDDEVESDPLSVARDVARTSRVVVLCGGTEKHVVTPDGRAWLVQGGGPGLGVSGSGDVQAGIVAGLVARGAEPAQAATWGAYLHARAGERLAASVGVVGYLARELPAQVPQILVELG
ncbi:ADP-dependent NAD(P)H-hydrate dehydratase [Nocardioides lijunqiniae]|uniref:ADP-dependent NAD(P)H-hydrate dehydratase n=1 Tax=Nocardioides lijunqiniae TaxID=2760832 RepID=UPI0018785EF4|nr:ADP/ATP-dependent (S)-NAD(P)H-hydrate dehydratase [Nocardioides lijunqiniae]